MSLLNLPILFQDLSTFETEYFSWSQSQIFSEGLNLNFEEEIPNLLMNQESTQLQIPISDY